MIIGKRDRFLEGTSATEILLLADTSRLNLEGRLMNNQLYFERLEAALKSAARRAFAGLKEAHADERFYSFALITNDQASFV